MLGESIQETTQSFSFMPKSRMNQTMSKVSLNPVTPISSPPPVQCSIEKTKKDEKKGKMMVGRFKNSTMRKQI